jgi:hypothetical protein
MNNFFQALGKSAANFFRGGATLRGMNSNLFKGTGRGFMRIASSILGSSKHRPVGNGLETAPPVGRNIPTPLRPLPVRQPIHIPSAIPIPIDVNSMDAYGDLFGARVKGTVADKNPIPVARPINEIAYRINPNRL